MTAQLVVDIVTNAAGAVAGFKKVDQAAANTASKTTSAGSKIATLAKAVATGYAVEKVIDFGKESVDAAQNAAQANARLAALFKNTGDTTGEAAKKAEEYADSLGKQIGVSPQVIEGAQGILTAFHAVSDETGRQSGLFDGATKAAADLAAAGFGDLTSNAKLLGKSLSDPTKGMTTLRKAGVVLTQAQQDQIKAMQKSGDLLGAQKTLLGDVNKAVGGTAAATATAGSKMGVAWEEAKVQIGTKLLPVINNVKAVLLTLITFVSAHADWIGPMAIGIGILGGAVATITAATKVWGAAMTVVKGIQAAWTAATKIAVGVQAAFDAVLDANPVVLIILAVLALIAGIILLVTHVSVVRAVMLEVWHTVGSVASTIFHGILSVIASVWNWIKANWPLLLSILLGPIGAAAALIIRHWSDIQGAAMGVWNWLARTWSSVYNFIITPVLNAINWIKGGFGGLVSWLTGLPGEVGRAIAGVYNAIVGPFQSAWNFIQNDILGPLKGAWNGVANVINGVSIKTPSVSLLGHTVIPAFEWRPPFHIPTLASGGVFDKATLAVVGEAGREIVTPEALLRQIVGGSGSDTHITINVNVPPTANPAAVGRSVVDALRAYVRANGPVPGIAS